jgi:hypothetical protein
VVDEFAHGVACYLGGPARAGFFLDSFLRTVATEVHRVKVCAT